MFYENRSNPQLSVSVTNNDNDAFLLNK